MMVPLHLDVTQCFLNLRGHLVNQIQLHQILITLEPINVGSKFYSLIESYSDGLLLIEQLDLYVSQCMRQLASPS